MGVAERVLDFELDDELLDDELLDDELLDDELLDDELLDEDDRLLLIVEALLEGLDDLTRSCSHGGQDGAS